jgi:hypothetical protein
MNSIQNKSMFTCMAVLLLTGCTFTPRVQLVDSDETQLQTRSYQSRVLENTNRTEMLRDTVATLQDLGFVIDNADSDIGIVSGTKLGGGILKITVTVRSQSQHMFMVRANAQRGITPITDPEPYQDFFTALDKSRHLTANEVQR